MALISKGFQDFEKGKVPTFMDSGASDTMFISKDAFTLYKSIDPRMGDTAKANDGSFEIIGEGNVTQQYIVDGRKRDITYTRALHAPTLNANLVSISALDRAGLTITFANNQGVARKTDGTVVLAGRGVKGMYLLETVNDGSHTPIAMSSLSRPVSLEQWHRRMAHCSPLTIKDMSTTNLVDGLILSDTTINGKCEDCIMGRQARRPFDGESEKASKPLDLVSFDLWGPSRTKSSGGKIYLMIIVDAGTSYKYGAYLADKADATTLAAFEIFHTQAEILTGRKLQRLRTDGAFDTSIWRNYCQQRGILHGFTAPYSSSQNGLAERAIRTTIDDVRTLLRDSALGHSYWAEAAAFSIYTRNLIPSRRLPGHIPLESFTGKQQNIAHLRVFGAKCWAKIPTVHGVQVTGGSKLDPRSAVCRLLGYGTGSGNYKVQDVETGRMYISRDVIFEEGQPKRTSANVGEQTIPLFDAEAIPFTDALPMNKDHPIDPAITDDHQNIDHDIPVTVPISNSPVIPAITVDQRRSTRAPKPSKAGQYSAEYQQREAMEKEEGHD